MKRWTKAAALFLALAVLLGLGAFAVSEAEAVQLFAGRWTDKENGMEMEVKYSGSAFSIEITAPTEKADVRLIWLIAGLYSEEDGAVVYEGCLWGERTYTDGDQYTDDFRDSDKQGFFTLDGSRIV